MCRTKGHLQLWCCWSTTAHHLCLLAQPQLHVLNGDDFGAFLGHHEVFCPLILSLFEILEVVTLVFFHCIHISFPDTNSSHTTFVCNRNIPFYSHPNLIVFCPLVQQPWCSLWLSGTHPSSHVSHQQCNFLGDCLISVEVFSITSYPSPWRVGLTLQFSSATAMFFWWYSFSFSLLHSLKPHQSNLGCFICQQTVKKHGLPSILHRQQCHYCTVDAGVGHGSIHIINILYLLMTPF